MANGLFATKPMNTAGEIQRLMQLEQEKRIRDAGAGFTNPLVRARAMAGQGMQEAISGIGTGLTGLLGGEGKIRMDPRMQEAMKRDKDRVEILGILEGFSDPSSEGGATISDAELRRGHAELLKRGYLKEAQAFLEQSQSMRKLGLEERKVDITEDAQKFDEKYKMSSLSLQERNQKLDEIMGRHKMGLDDKKFGLSEKDYELKRDIHLAQVAFRDRTQGWQEKMDKINTRLKERGLAISEEGNLIQRTKVEADIDLAKKRFTLDEEKQIFQQDLQTSKLGIEKMLANNKVFVDGEQLDLKRLGLEQAREIAQMDHDLRRELGLGNLDHKRASLKLRKHAIDNDIELRHMGHNLSERQHSENMELMRDRFVFDKDKFTRTMNETMKQRVVDTELRNRSLELRERGYDIDEMDRAAKRNLAAEMFAEDKRMNIHKMSEDEKNRHLTEQLAQYDNFFKSQNIDIQKQGLTWKKEALRLRQQHESELRNLADQTTRRGQDMTQATALAKASGSAAVRVKPLTDKQTDAVEDKMSANKDRVMQLLGESDYGPWNTSNINRVSRTIESIMAKNKVRNVDEAFDIFLKQGWSAGKTGVGVGSGSGDPFSGVKGQ